MDIELRDLRCAVSVARYRSLRRAADALGVRQSTLSRRVRAVEDAVGAPLFERTCGGTRPTTAGLELVEFARRLLEDTETVIRDLRRRSRGENGRLTIGVYASFATGNLRATLAEYQRRLPDVDIHTVDGSHSRLIAALERSAVDVAVMTMCQGKWHDRELQLWTERVIVALPERHPLAEQQYVNWAQLADERFILPLHGPGAELESLLAAKLNGEKPKRVLHQDTGLDRLLSLVGTGHGLLLMLEGGTGLKQDGVIFREVREGSEPTRLGFAAYWNDANENPTLGAFLNMLGERYPDLSGALAPG